MPFSGINNQESITFGIETGAIGRTGWFVSFVPPIKSKYYIAEDVEDPLILGFLSLNWIEKKFIKKIGESSTNYYYTFPEDSSFLNHFRAIAGVTQRIGENTFLKVGFGWAYSRRYYRIYVIRNTGSPQTDRPFNGKYYAKGQLETYCYAVKAGLTYRISNRYLISLDAITGLNPWDNNIAPLKLEITLGLGYNF